MLLPITLAALALAGCDQAAMSDLAAAPDSSSSATPTGSSSATPVPSATATASASSSPSASASSSAAPAASDTGSPPALTPAQILALFSADGEGGGMSNIVRVINQRDAAVRADGRVQDKRLHGKDANPVNQAFAYSSCLNCQTYSVALQIVVTKQGASPSQPVNEALAVNYHCTGCTTVARALQYVIPEPDPDNVPDHVQRLAAQWDRQLRSIQSTPGITPAQAEAQINSVIGQFQDLAQNLSDKRSETTDPDSPNASPIPSSSASAAPASSAPSNASSSPTSIAAPSSSASASAGAQASATATPTATPPA
ncbi:MAG: hypothetical protein JO247_12420 [Chloroflexi bacterium]|nr:hypothetical protein [Chloroflexota bacterium]